MKMGFWNYFKKDSKNCNELFSNYWQK